MTHRIVKQANSFSNQLAKILEPDDNGLDLRRKSTLFCNLLPILVVSYIDKSTMLQLIETSHTVLRQVVLNTREIPLSLLLEGDFRRKMPQAKSELETLKKKHKTLSFSLELCVNSKGDDWFDDFRIVQGLGLFIVPKHEDRVHSIIIRSLHIELAFMHESIAYCISQMQGLKKLDLRGLQFEDVQVFENHFAPELTTLCTLEELKVNLRTLPMLLLLGEKSTRLQALTVDGTETNGNRSSLFSTLSALTKLVSLTTFSAHKMRFMTKPEAETFITFVDRQSQLSQLSLSSFDVFNSASDGIVELLKDQTRLQKLKFDSVQIRSAYWDPLLEHIREMTRLEKLTFARCHCAPEHMEKFCYGLSNMTRLQSLNLRYLSLSRQSVPKLTAALTNLERLRQLDLSNTGFPDIDMSSFAAVLITRKFTRLRLDNCGMKNHVRNQMLPVLQKQI